MSTVNLIIRILRVIVATSLRLIFVVLGNIDLVLIIDVRTETLVQAGSE